MLLCPQRSCFLDFYAELGSGCALAGIVAARYAREVYLTDYIPQVCFF